jgi:hypothetical protein
MYTVAPSPLTPRQSSGLRFDLLIICGFLSVVMAAACALALVGIASVRDTAREAVAVDGRLSQLASEVARQSLESRRYEKDFFLNAADPPMRSGYLVKWHTTSAQLDQAITAFAVAATAPEDQQQATRWRIQAAQYEQAFEQ